LVKERAVAKRKGGWQYLHWVPGAGKWRSVTQIEVIQCFDSGVLKECRGYNVDSFRDFGTFVPQQLCPEQFPGILIAGNPNGELASVWIIRFMIPEG
jgi:hypothetical protein